MKVGNLAAILLLGACSHADPTGAPAVAPGSEEEEGGCLDTEPGDPGKADSPEGSAARKRKFLPLGRMRFGQTVTAPAAVDNPAWSFYARAGASVDLAAPGASGISLYGPKPIGADWPSALQEAASDKLTATLPADGLYGVVVKQGANLAVTLSCASAACAPDTWARPLAAQALSLVMVGDLGLTVSDAPVDHQGGFKTSQYQYYPEMLDGFAHYLSGHVNLANLETAVSTGGSKQDKQFVFRMPTEALDAVTSSGLNLLGAANNHAGDYGDGGIVDTIAALDKALASGAIGGKAGIGVGFDAAAAPAVFKVQGARIAYASCGIGYNVRSTGKGIAHVSDADKVIARLASTDADLRILSIHAGVERDLSPAPVVLDAARTAIDAGIAVVHAHHPHVVQGIERRGNGLIFYSMGNFELRGAANMAAQGADRDYGIAARLQFDPATRRLLEVEVAAVYDMHQVVVPLTQPKAGDRLHRLNQRSAGLGSAGLELAIDAVTGQGSSQL
jgi:hypothetical protein